MELEIKGRNIVSQMKRLAIWWQLEFSSEVYQQTVNITSSRRRFQKSLRVASPWLVCDVLEGMHHDACPCILFHAVTSME